ncbi:Uma2 family endonuclease [Streptomyces sp. NPDC088197]|uniref:Uma2 family endonuclease n=1 Tax=unclassified Streptomyces TaxID=2593676 RepID=UPI003807BD78
MEGKLTAHAAENPARQERFRTLARYLMTHSLRRTLPAHLRVRRDVAVVVDDRTVAEPDIVVVGAEAENVVVLAVEVLPADADESEPHPYEEAGVTHLWRVEEDTETERPMVYVHEWDPASHSYALTGVHREELTVQVPYRINVDLTGIDHL